MQSQKTGASSAVNNAPASLHFKGKEVMESKRADHEGRFLTAN